MTTTRALLIAVLLSGLCATACEDQPADNLPRDEWQAVLMGNARVGYMHTTMRRDGDLVVTSSTMTVTMRRLGTEVTVEAEQTFRERPDGTPVSFETVMRASGMEITRAGTIEGDTLTLVSSQGGRSRERTLEWDPETLFPYALDRKTRALALEPGETLTVRAFSGDLGTTEPVEITIEVIGPDTVDVLGVAHDAVKVEMKMPGLLAGRPTTMWLDAERNVLAMQLPVMGVRTVRCTKAYALAEVEPAEIEDLMLITPDKPLRTPDRLERLVVKLSTEDGSPLSVELPSFGHQRVLERDESSVTLEISHALVETAEDDLEPYLARTAYLDHGDERIVAAAHEAVGDETDPWRRAQVLRRAVHERIEGKNLDTAFASASEVIEAKSGDCTEHAVLLAAMARAQAIPSRVAIGLMYLRGRFGYHMWTQVYVDGAWRDLDAVLPEGDFDATHIRLTTSALGDKDFLFDLGAFAAVFGNLKIEIVESGSAARSPQR